MLAICVCLWTSCSDGGSEEPANPNPKPEEVVTPEITISSDILTNGLTFNTTQGEKSVSFSTNVDWTLSIASTTGGSSRCKASATSGSKGSANVNCWNFVSVRNRFVRFCLSMKTVYRVVFFTRGVNAVLVNYKNGYNVAFRQFFANLPYNSFELCR